MITGEEIRTLRIRLDLTQREFGALLGCSGDAQRRTVQLWEAEKRLPCLQTLRHMRTLIAVSNALLTLKIGKTNIGIAIRMLEQVFKDSGAVLTDEFDIEEIAQKMRRQRI